MESLPTEYSERTPTLEEDPALGLPHRAKMEILFAVMLGLFLGALDQTIVGPALPTIVTELDGNDVYVWAVTIYLLTSTISVPFWGKLSDLYGRKPLFMIGIVIFLVGSALSGLSPGHDPAHPLPRHPGHRRRLAVPDRPRGHRRPVHPGRARQVPGPLRRRVRHRVHRRPARRRLPDRADPLALDLLRQHPDRARLAVLHLAAAADRQEPAGDPQLRHPRRGDLHGRHRPSCSSA